MRRKTTFEVRWADENTWDAVVENRGSTYKRVYGWLDVAEGGEPVSGAPTEEKVREDWKDDPKSFRKIGS